MKKPKWTSKFPKRAGTYWFYGYRYGKISCGTENKKELKLVKARKGGNCMIYVAEGAFLFENEVEEPLFTKAILPELPTEEKPE